MQRIIKFAVIVSAITILLLIGVEYGYRSYAAFNHSTARFKIVLIDGLYHVEDAKKRTPDDGIYLPNRKVNRFGFDKDHTLLYHGTIETNAQGYRSIVDYPPPSGQRELRIAVLGDSMTASHLSDASWTDVALELLNNDRELLSRLNIDRIYIYNFGVMGAGFDTFAQVYFDHARRFDPDLVLVNFIEADFFRKELRIEAVTDIGLGEPLFRGTVDISTHKIDADAVIVCTSQPVVLGRRDCKPEFLIKMDRQHFLDRKGVRDVKRQMSKKFIWAQLLRSTFPYSIAAALGEKFYLRNQNFFDVFPIIIREIATNSDWANRPNPNEDDLIARSSLALQKIQETAPNLVLIYNPLSEELLKGVLRSRLGQQLADRASLPIIHMAEALPDISNHANVRSWFHLPHDGHFNNEGIFAYGGAVYRVVRELLLSGGWRQSQHKQPFDYSATKATD